MALFVAKVAKDRSCGLAINESVEALMDLELNQPIWMIHYWDNGDYNCTKGGNQICIE